MSSGPHGQTVVRIEVRWRNEGHPDWVSYRVVATKRDGTEVTVNVSNPVTLVKVVGGKITVTPRVPGRNVLPPLTMDQITALALDHGLVLHP